MTPFSLNIGGHLVEYTRPVVMGILNCTPDSLYAGSRAQTAADVERRVGQMIGEGADIIDVGACSTRPGASEVTPAEETDRLASALAAIKRVAPDAIVSVDTFRADVARSAVCEMGAHIINDVSSGHADAEMFDTVADLQVPYVLTHSCGVDIYGMHQVSESQDIVASTLQQLAVRLDRLNLLGVNDVIIDPGFGFGKDLEQNYRLLAGLEAFSVFHLPLLVGLSRKSMIKRLLDIATDDAANATTAANTIALMHGASILRVHDVKAAREAVEIYTMAEKSR